MDAEIKTEGATPEKEWDTSLYDGKHSFVWKYGADVIGLLAPRKGERILDLGCGTGHLTNKIAEQGAETVGIDYSSDMIEQARKNYPGLTFEIGDGTDFHFDEPFDAVFSNAAIHWMKDPEAVARCVWQALKPGGRFVAEFGGRGNLKSIQTTLLDSVRKAVAPEQPSPSYKYYPSIGEFASLLEKQGFRVTYATHFDRPTALEEGEDGLRNWLATFSDNLLSTVPEEKRDQVICEIEDRLRPELYRDGTWFADYKRIRIVAVKW
jgi:trans-aconitate 2-methyltransferase